MRRTIARTMTISAGIPQFTIEREVDTTALATSRGSASITDLLIAACARGLRSHPRLNASYTEDGILEHDAVNVGLAINLTDGLIVPAIMDADRLDLRAIASERERLTAAANAGRLRPEEVLNTTFTISNLGPVGVRRFQALVVPPQAAILAVGAVTPEQRMSLCLSCDHRIVDGLPAALFLRDVVEYLERPPPREEGVIG
jgi:pyruvate dehydrogenase E2 component (dihydrolipoamide acetyltransferase)